MIDLAGTRMVVTGAAGFIGGHLCQRLLDLGAEVVGIDNLSTGTLATAHRLGAHRRCQWVDHDVIEPFDVDGPVTHVLHFASPASPRDYLRMPIETMLAGSAGTHNAIAVAQRTKAMFMLASTSEVYGNPEVNPQREDYSGNVSITGPRSVYDEAKRYAEALVQAHHREHGLDVRVPRIFNTYGPGTRIGDGRAVPTFIDQALRGAPMTVHGSGHQTRTLLHVDDLVDGLVALLDADLTEPCNLGGDREIRVEDLAILIRDLAESSSEIIHTARPVDDPSVRRPDLSTAARRLGFRPSTSLRAGLLLTIAWHAQRLLATSSSTA